MSEPSSGETNFVLGAFPSPPDNRDYILDPVALGYNTGELLFNSDLPDKFSLKKYLPPVRNQGSQGSCVAQTGACIKEYHECRDYGFNTDGDNGEVGKMVDLPERAHMSPQFLYNNRENYPRYGWYGRSLMNFLQTSGVCFEDTFPYNKKSEKEQIEEGVLRGDQIPQNAWKEAANHKISAYAWVQYVNDDNENNEYRLKKSLMDNGPAYISFPVYSGAGAEFWKKLNDDGTERAIRGGHAVAVVGWDTDGFILRNSWGKSWNGDGYVVYPYADFFKKCHWEIITAVDADSPYVKWPKKDKGCCTVM